MRRLALALIVAVLSTAATGVPSLVVAEPCGLVEASGADEGTCLPTCVVCGCCAQPAVPVPLVLTSTPDLPVPEAAPPLSLVPDFDPRKIPHVPKTRLA